MAQADGTLLELLVDDVRRELLVLLLCADDPLTQSELTRSSGYNSSTISRRMGELEDRGLVARQSPKAPYEVLFPGKTRDLLEAAADLAAFALKRMADDAEARARNLRRAGLAGGRLRDQAREGA